MEFEDIIKEQMNQVIDRDKTASLSEYASELTNGISDYFTIENILDATLEGKSIFSSPELIDGIKTLFLYELKAAAVVSIEILGICIIIGLFDNLSGAFGKKSAGEIGSLTCAIIIAGIILVNFQDVYAIAVNTMNTMTYTVEILVPILIGILVSMGKIVSGTILSPLLLTSVAIFQNIIKNIIFPALFISTVLSILNSLTEKNMVNQSAKLIRNLAIFITGLLLTLMSGIISIQGLITKTSDGLIMGTAKYSLDAFIPIVGGFTADTIELFLSCMGAIKSVVGIFGIMLILTLLFIPIIKTILIALIYKITAALIEPLTSKRIVQSVEETGSVLIILSAILFFASLLYIIFLTSIMRIGG